MNRLFFPCRIQIVIRCPQHYASALSSVVLRYPLFFSPGKRALRNNARANKRKNSSPPKLSVLRNASSRKDVLFKRTNLENTGLISTDRNNKATLLLTIPSSAFKSSAKDLSSPIFVLLSRGYHSHASVLRDPSLV